MPAAFNPAFAGLNATGAPKTLVSLVNWPLTNLGFGNHTGSCRSAWAQPNDVHSMNFRSQGFTSFDARSA
jgi:hypothetical protein